MEFLSYYSLILLQTKLQIDYKFFYFKAQPIFHRISFVSVKIIIWGNKADQEPEIQRTMTFDQGKEIADNYNAQYIETSAKDNINVDELFQKLLKAKKSHY